MRKFLAAAIAASMLAASAAHADPALMAGVGITLGGPEGAQAGFTAKVLTSDKQGEPVGAAGISLYPWAGQKFGLDLGAGYNFNEGAAVLSYDFLQRAPQASGGWVNTRESVATDPGPCGVSVHQAC